MDKVTHTHVQARTHVMKHTHLCCTVHNKSCFIKARSHPLSVYNHRSRLNRRGNTIPFRFGVILIYELVSATLVCVYGLGKHPQERSAAPVRLQDRLVHTKLLVAQYMYVYIFCVWHSNYCISCLLANSWRAAAVSEVHLSWEKTARQMEFKEDKSLNGVNVWGAPAIHPPSRLHSLSVWPYSTCMTPDHSSSLYPFITPVTSAFHFSAPRPEPPACHGWCHLSGLLGISRGMYDHISSLKGYSVLSLMWH